MRDGKPALRCKVDILAVVCILVLGGWTTAFIRAAYSYVCHHFIQLMDRDGLNFFLP